MGPKGSLPCSQDSATSLSWARSIQSTSPHPVSLYYYYSPIYVYVFPVVSFPSGFPTKILYEPPSHACCMPCPYNPPWLSLNHTWAKLIQYTHFHPISLKSIWISPTHINLSLLSDLLPSGFPTRSIHISHPSCGIAQQVYRPGYRMGGWGVGDSIPSEGKRFFHLYNVQTVSGAHLASCAMDNGGCFPGAKVARAWSWPTHLKLMPRLRMVELYLQSPLHLCGIALNWLSPGIILPLPMGATFFIHLPLLIFMKSTNY
jgi:hypothetical protein